MKKGASSLNPYAASYIPLSNRGAVDQNKLSYSEGHVSPSYVPNFGALQITESLEQKGHHPHKFHSSSSHHPKELPEKSNFDEELIMDLAFLRLKFPDISEESLSDLYVVNNFDLEATVDMLNQLEILSDDSSDKLPDTLDIGDVLESGPSNLTAEGGASTSGSSKLPWRS